MRLSSDSGCFVCNISSFKATLLLSDMENNKQSKYVIKDRFYGREANLTSNNVNISLVNKLPKHTQSYLRSS